MLLLENAFVGMLKYSSPLFAYHQWQCLCRYAFDVVQFENRKRTIRRRLMMHTAESEDDSVNNDKPASAVRSRHFLHAATVPDWCPSQAVSLAASSRPSDWRFPTVLQWAPEHQLIAHARTTPPNQQIQNNKTNPQTPIPYCPPSPARPRTHHPQTHHPIYPHLKPDRRRRRPASQPASYT